MSKPTTLPLSGQAFLWPLNLDPITGKPAARWVCEAPTVSGSEDLAAVAQRAAIVPWASSHAAPRLRPLLHLAPLFRMKKGG